MAFSVTVPSAAVAVSRTHLASRQSPPGMMRPTIGMRTSSATALTSFDVAAPMITPIARANALERVRKALNSPTMPPAYPLSVTIPLRSGDPLPTSGADWNFTQWRSLAGTRAIGTHPNAVHAREHRRRLSRGLSQPSGKPDRAQGGSDRQSQVRDLRRRKRDRPAGDGPRLPQRGLALRLLPRPDLHARAGSDDPG